MRQLLCVLTRDNPKSTDELCSLLMDRINLILNGHLNNYDLGMTVRYEIALMAALVQKEDECWELKLRYMMKLFLRACENSRSPLVMESVILPCLKILSTLIKPPEHSSKKSKEKANMATAINKPSVEVAVDICRWLNKDPAHSFTRWKARLSQKSENGVGLPSERERVSTSLYL